MSNILNALTRFELFQIGRTVATLIGHTHIELVMRMDPRITLRS